MLLPCKHDQQTMVVYQLGLVTATAVCYSQRGHARACLAQVEEVSGAGALPGLMPSGTPNLQACSSVELSKGHVWQVIVAFTEPYMS